ncbi:MAG: hypothetical protein KJ767_03510 [Nanoarchaeota archaeon]|nr:hypothetical protein [Nanoarchaeota archaeon]
MVLNIFAQYGGGFLDFRFVLEMWRSAGLFDVVLPFILIFAVIFAILEKSKVLGQNKAVHAIVSLALAFFAISNPWLNGFFAILFSNAAIGFAILLVVILFLGFFITDNQQTWWVWVGGIFAVAIFFWVLSRSLQESGMIVDVYGWLYSNPFLGSLIVYGIPVILMIIAVIFAPAWTEPKGISIKGIKG